MQWSTKLRFFSGRFIFLGLCRVDFLLRSQEASYHCLPGCSAASICSVSKLYKMYWTEPDGKQLETLGSLPDQILFFISQTWRSSLKITRIRPEASRIRPTKSRIRPATTPDRTRRTRPGQTNGTSDQTNATSDQTQDSPDLRATGSVANQSFRGPKHDSRPSERGFGWSAVIDTRRLEGFPRKQHQFLAKAPGTRGFQTHQESSPLTPQNMNSSLQKSVLDSFCHLDLTLEGFADQQRPFLFFEAAAATTDQTRKHNFRHPKCSFGWSIAIQTCILLDISKHNVRLLKRGFGWPAAI